MFAVSLYLWAVIQRKVIVITNNWARTRVSFALLFSYLTVKFTDIWPRHQALPELFGPVPDQVQAGLLEEEGQEAQVAVQILTIRFRETVSF